MRKWLIVILAVLFLSCYGSFFLVYSPALAVQAAPKAVTTAPTETTAPETTAAETMVPATTVPETAAPETIPAETAAVSHRPEPDPDYVLTARSAFVYDCDSGQLLYTLGDMDAELYPASLTKLFTAWVVLQHMDPQETVIAGSETTWIDPASSVAEVTAGDRVTVETLIQGMMMQSGNDAAYTAAVATGLKLSGDETYPPEYCLELFMDEVNTQAQRLGLTGTHFATPDGLDAWDHYTTMSDMLQITLLALREPLMRHYAGLTTATVVYENGETHTYKNTNFLLHQDSEYYCADACGLKTGTTKKAGSCLMALFHNGEKYLLIGIFGCPEYEDRFADALHLYAQYG